MKCAIFYFSCTGNTKYICEDIASKLPYDVSLYDITTIGCCDLNQYDLVGFATFTDFGGPSELFIQFVDGLAVQNRKPAFVINTYGFVSMKTVKFLENIVTKKGFDVLAGHSLHTPESYPPMIAKGLGFKNSPNNKDLYKFNEFIDTINSICNCIDRGDELHRQKVKLSMLNRLMPTLSRKTAGKDMGQKIVDKSLCKSCGECESGCPYKAITLDIFPTFDLDKCHGCWKCYNRCSKEAIFTKRYNGSRYPTSLLSF